jgi:hypothetical protein
MWAVNLLLLQTETCIGLLCSGWTACRGLGHTVPRLLKKRTNSEQTQPGMLLIRIREIFEMELGEAKFE